LAGIPRAAPRPEQDRHAGTGRPHDVAGAENPSPVKGFAGFFVTRDLRFVYTEALCQFPLRDSLRDAQ